MKMAYRTTVETSAGMRLADISAITSTHNGGIAIAKDAIYANANNYSLCVRIQTFQGNKLIADTEIVSKIAFSLTNMLPKETPTDSIATQSTDDQ